MIKFDARPQSGIPNSRHAEFWDNLSETATNGMCLVYPGSALPYVSFHNRQRRGQYPATAKFRTVLKDKKRYCWLELAGKV
jgi:hypothetical protein